MSKLLQIKSNGINFNVRTVNQGENYGLNGSLTHNESDPLIEFYDARFAHTEFGQFVSRYNLSTLLELEENVGLNLYGGSPNWSIEAKEMNDVVAWLYSQRPTTVSKKKM